MNARQYAEEIYKLYESPSIYSAQELLQKTSSLIQEALQEALNEERQKMREHIYNRENKFARGMPGHPDNEMGM